MNNITICEIKAIEIKMYKLFLAEGLINDEENFRLTTNDDLNNSFPTEDNEDSFTLGAFENKQLAGVVCFMRDGRDREKLRHKGILFRMYISNEFRGRGIAKKLIEEVILRVKKIKDIEQINLTVISNNTTAKGLYEKFGFVTFASETNAIKWKNKYFTENQMVLKIIK